MKSERLYEGIGMMDDKWLKLLDEEPEESAAAGEKEQHRFVGYELKKLLGVKYLWVFLFVLLMLNTAAAWVSAGRSPAAKEPTQMISDFFDLYFENPAEIDAHHEEMLSFAAEQEALVREAMRMGNFDYAPEVMPNRFSTDENYSDTMLFSKLYSAIEAAKDYPEVLDKVIDRAWANLDAFSDMGIEEDSFAYRYQLRVIGLYEEMRDSVEIGVEYTRGWNEYFAYDTGNVFVFFMLVMLGSILFAQEKQSGFLPILRAAKHGRARTAMAKILTMLLLTALFTLMFTLTSFAVYGLRLGYSSPHNVIQALPAFTLSPYRITIGQYFAVTLGVKLLAFSAFSMIVTALSALFYNYIMIYLAGLGLFGLNFLFYTLKYIDANSVFKNLNLVTAAAASPLFIRYRAMNLFGTVAGFVPVLCVLFPLVIFAGTAAAVILYVRGSSGIRIGWVDAAAAWVLTKTAKARHALSHVGRRKKSRSYSRSLVLTEVFKTLISSRFLAIVLLILTVKVWYSVKINTPMRSYADAVYKEYMTSLEGEVTEDKLNTLAAERAMIDETLSKQSAMQEAYVNEEISFEEYRAFLSDYNYAYSRSELLSVIEKHADYLVSKEAETGVKGWFLYDTGWRRLVEGDADLFLYASILLLLTGSFAAEYVSKSSSGGFAQLLRSTKNGRLRTFRAKLCSSGMIALILALLTEAVDAAVIAKGYLLPAADAPLVSVERFADVTGGITVGQYCALFFLMRTAGALIMAMLVCALSELLARYIPVLGTSVILTLLPALCAYFGLRAADRVNFLNLLAGTPLFLESARISLFGSGYAMLVLWLAVAVLAVSAMLWPAKRMFVK
ncbi:MAG: hypothetical protein IKQ92_05105 [Clostridia bacterium]|nr:hypothetical protein [Clostridia bacterium]